MRMSKKEKSFYVYKGIAMLSLLFGSFFVLLEIDPIMLSGPGVILMTMGTLALGIVGSEYFLK